MLRAYALLLIVIVIAAACSGVAPATPTGPSPAPAASPAPAGPPTVTITAAGLSPLEISIAVGQRVTFVNNDARAHDLVGGPEPSVPECPEVTAAGFLVPGQRAETGVFTAPGTCRYHDHAMMGVPAFEGRIIIR